MATLSQIENKLSGLDLWEVVSGVILKHKEEIIDINLSQLQQGKLNDGDLLEAYKSAAYVEYKKARGLLNTIQDRPNLFFEGDFYKGFFIKTDSEGVVFDSGDEKTQRLEAMYSSEIFGIKENMDQLIEVILPDVRVEVKNILL